MDLYLLRHGIAVEPGTPGFEDDATRPLIPKGRRQLRNSVEAMKELGLDFDLILSSPLVRARQTAEIVVRRLKLKKRLQLSNALAPQGQVKHLLRQLEREKPAPGSVLLVGHEPYLSQLISLLTTGGQNLDLDFKKGGLCKLEAEKLRAGRCARLVWLLTPKLMKVMARQ